MKRAVILGGAECVWEDLAALERLAGGIDGWTVIAVNDAAVRYRGRIDHFVTLHPEKLPGWIAARRVLVGGRREYEVWSTKPPWRIIPNRYLAGSSGMTAVAVAEELGINRIVLCGVPMDSRPHFVRGEPWRHHAMHATVWRANAPMLRGYTRSMSGWTREVLGAPDREWLCLSEAAEDDWP